MLIHFIALDGIEYHVPSSNILYTAKMQNGAENRTVYGIQGEKWNCYVSEETYKRVIRCLETVEDRKDMRP